MTTSEAPFGREQTEKLLLTLAVATASFLSFSIQPITAKMLLPSQGGSSAAWLGSMLFFQIAVLAGYSLSAWLTRQPGKRQTNIVLALTACGVVAPQLPPVFSPSEGSVLSVLLSLTVSLLPTTLLLFSTPTLLHAWWPGTAGKVPYHVYAISNLGSLAALLIYPLGIEPSLEISTQALGWRLLLLGFGILVAVLALKQRRHSGTSVRSEEAAAGESITLVRRISWVVVSAIGCVAMLGTTYHLSAEIGSTPLTWVGPLGFYILSFALVFSGLWRSQATFVCTLLLGVSLSGYMITKGIGVAATRGPSAVWLLCLGASASFAGTALLYRLRPQKRYGSFYLYLALGGVVGGLLSSIVAPTLHTRPFELIAAAVLILVASAVPEETKHPLRAVSLACVLVITPVVCLVWKQNYEVRGADRVVYFRNIYGAAMIRLEPNGGIVLSNETTTHGSQLTATPESRLRPTLYYTESTGVGRAIQQLQSERSELRIGVIGLGAGTLCAYARPTDSITFWDIDPKAEELAAQYFSYIKDCKGHVTIEQRDGRKGLEAAKENFDLIIIDAFAGDFIPAHLLTREAMRLYQSRLATNHGLLLVHASNRYNIFFPVVSATAKAAGLRAINVVTEISAVGDQRDWDPVLTQYIVICTPEQLVETTRWYPESEDNGRVKRSVAANPKASRLDPGPWTDEKNSVMDTIRLGNLFAR